MAQQPLAGGSFRNWLRLLYDNGGIHSDYLLRAAFVTMVTAACAPFRVYERMRYGKLLEGVDIEHPPVFILGHWRSGTTHLHNVLSQDPQFGYLSTFQAVAPEFCLAGQRPLRPIMKVRVPETRYMDNMALSLDHPQEDEVAVANLCLHSFYHYWSFPLSMERYVREGLFFDGEDGALAQWRAAYEKIVKKATFMSGGKRIVLKNPANTGRIRHLLDLFPGAKFIHIYRNPYTVFPSTKLLHKKVLGIAALQRVSDEQVAEHVIDIYKQVMARYFEEEPLIPREDFAEVRFEEYEKEPVGETQRIYEELGLSGFDAAEGRIREYVDSLKGYQKNKFDLSEEMVERLKKEWAFTIDRWGYGVPE
jgi:hypothetical protein